VLRAAQAHPHPPPHYTAPLGGPSRGRGVAMGFWGNGGGRSSATLNVNDDGTLNLVTGSVDLCGTRTSLAMQAAETLELPLISCAPPSAIPTPWGTRFHRRQPHDERHRHRRHRGGQKM